MYTISTRLKYIFTLSIGLLANCVPIENGLPIISPANLHEIINLDDFCNELYYLQLENSILLSNILDIKKDKEGYYIKTRDGLFLFNNQGKYRFQIGKKGSGPEEYLFVEDFVVDEKAQQIYILNRKNIKVFDSSGNYIRSFETPEKETFFEMEIQEDRLIFPKGFGFMPLEKAWWVTDLEGNPVDEKPNHITTDEMRVEYKANLCFEAENKIFYWNQLNDTVFQIGAHPGAAYLFANDNFRVTENDLASEENYRNKESWQLITILGTDRYLFFDYLLLKDRKRNYTVYDKQKKQHYMYAQENLGQLTFHANPIDNGPLLIPKSKFFNNNKEYLVGWIDSYKIKAHVESEAFKNSTPKFPEKKKELEQLADSLNENDNPVLMLVKLKE